MPAGAQQMFKCGATYQDRPCAAQEAQQRFSHASGSFSIKQVNPNTDKDCAASAAEAMPFWQRMRSGESLDSLKAEIDARPISRYEKSRLRDHFIALDQHKGTPGEVRSQLESQCMADKRRRGIPTERQIAESASAQSSYEAAAAARTREAADRSRAADERMAMIEEARAQAEQRRAEYAARQAAAAAARAAAVEAENKRISRR
ncbi:MAG TPA: hypothetical protein VLJ58_17715 [Ramlibacter sp.]|nr:hypothetical protein [Ramlibacter sp.]